LDAAKRAIEPQLKAKVLHIDDTVTNIAEDHARFGYEIWTGRSDWEEMERAGRAAITTCQLKIWRKEPVFTERPTWGNAAWEYFMGLPATEKVRLRQTFEKQKRAPEQWHKTFEQLNIAERMKEVMPERYFAESQQPTPEAQDAAPVKVEKTKEPETEPALDPIVQASANLAARAALVMKSDSGLSRLAEHSPETRTRIEACLIDELLRNGSASGEFLARTYNALRPKGLFAFPERTFR
jgi:hypothetical protein